MDAKEGMHHYLGLHNEHRIPPTKCHSLVDGQDLCFSGAMNWYLMQLVERLSVEERTEPAGHVGGSPPPPQPHMTLPDNLPPEVCHTSSRPTNPHPAGVTSVAGPFLGATKPFGECVERLPVVAPDMLMG